jgi:cytochrome d ubiquinol oxidase subunit I
MSEMGRQPWVVNGLMKTSAGVSPNVTSAELLFSIIAFSVVYSLLAAAMVYLFIRVIKQGPQAKPMQEVAATDPFNTRRVG